MFRTAAFRLQGRRFHKARVDSRLILSVPSVVADKRTLSNSETGVLGEKPQVLARPKRKPGVPFYLQGLLQSVPGLRFRI